MDSFWFFLVQTRLGERNKLIYQTTDRLKIALLICHTLQVHKRLCIDYLQTIKLRNRELY